ncbi:MAG: DNA-directed RNA polymerase subunit K [Candidatus Hodarchaeota archaeon]
MPNKKAQKSTLSSSPGSEEEFKIDIGPPHLTRYERARTIGARALQLAFGAPILIELDDETIDTIQISKKELERGALPLSVRRTIPNGEYQDIPIRLLLS